MDEQNFNGMFTWENGSVAPQICPHGGRIQTVYITIYVYNLDKHMSEKKSYDMMELRQPAYGE